MRNSRLAALSVAAIDLLILPATLLSALLLRMVRRIGLHRLRWNRRLLRGVGMLPVRRHYYEPYTHPSDLRRPLDEERNLPGIQWNVTGQLELLRSLVYASELQDLTAPAVDRAEFRLGNGSFESGDAEFLYQMIRAIKPKQIIEIGSGYSTLMARRAIDRNRKEITDYECRHICIEPYEAPWLERFGVTVLRERVEELGNGLFSELGRDDLLFIDSSHIIRPQGDVVTEYLELLPSLRLGVIVHVHDVFSPRDYPPEWVLDRMWLWNEQYLLEAFLSQNTSWRILAALNLLHHRHFEELRRVCPYLDTAREPGSFYIQRV
jgi:predicted O-methyltransferase YrrM